MKTKTATIRVNLYRFTMTEYYADIFYRGKLLYTFDGKHTGDLLAKARDWAHAQGFTHTKCTLG